MRDWDDGTITTFSRDGIKYPSQMFAALTTQELARFAIGVTLDREGNLYAFDVLDFNIKKFDNDGNIVASFGERATEPIVHNQITYPESIEFDSEDNLYVESEDRIFKFASDGKAVGKMKLVADDDNNDHGAVTQITDIAFDSSDDMYISNVQNRIIKFTNDGEFIEEYNMTQTTVSKFHLDSMRMSIDDKNNNIYVVGRIPNEYDNIVQKFSSGGNFITSWNHDHDESERGQPAMIPTAVTADHDENVYVAYYPSLIQKFSADGEFIAELKSPQMEVQFLQITAMTVDSEDNLYVADTRNKRIQKFFKDSIVSNVPDISQPNVDVSIGKESSTSTGIDNIPHGEEAIQTQDIFDSPLKQYKSDTSINEIKCNEFLTLMIKYDGHPACVKESTILKLVERGWVLD